MEGVNTNTFSPNLSVRGAYPPLPSFEKTARVCVIGAGAFGGWTALWLRKKGYNVTLVDAWGAGNSRSSSGDETRVVRSTYGANELYFQLNVRALELWKLHEKTFSKQIFFNSGVLWLCYQQENPLVDDSIPFADKYNYNYDRLDAAELRKRFPLINSDDLSHAFLDPYGGYVKAREACQEVKDAFIREGGDYVVSSVGRPAVRNKKVESLALSNGTTLRADAFVFACGSWLPIIFPELLSDKISCTRQEVYYFGVPAKNAQDFDSMPVWIDLDGKDFYYGIPGNASRGFKLGVDKRGPSFDPSVGDRIPNANVLHDARTFLEHRFPLLKGAPLVESRVCPYENSIDGNFIFDLHPDTENTFILGGGSGHGFKHGPALGELAANCMAGEAHCPDLFRMTN
jgi:glycine/D-amino acid oxidase-like deaminating enzyme